MTALVAVVLVAQRGGIGAAPSTPDNAGFFHVAYALAAVVYVGYAVRLLRESARV